MNTLAGPADISGRSFSGSPRIRWNCARLALEPRRIAKLAAEQISFSKGAAGTRTFMRHRRLRLRKRVQRSPNPQRRRLRRQPRRRPEAAKRRPSRRVQVLRPKLRRRRGRRPLPHLAEGNKFSTTLGGALPFSRWPEYHSLRFQLGHAERQSDACVNESHEPAARGTSDCAELRAPWQDVSREVQRLGVRHVRRFEKWGHGFSTSKPALRPQSSACQPMKEGERSHPRLYVPRSGKYRV
jgi:hypothetical protein